MKKFFRAISVAFACFGMILLVSCSKVSQSYADKINNAKEKNGEYMTLDQVRSDLGDEAVEILILNSGIIVAVRGCTTLDQVKEKIKAEENVEGILIIIAAGKATSANYQKITAEDLKA